MFHILIYFLNYLKSTGNFSLSYTFPHHKKNLSVPIKSYRKGHQMAACRKILLGRQT